MKLILKSTVYRLVGESTALRSGLVPYILFFGLLFAVRLYRLGSHDFWFDEIGSIRSAQHPWTTWNAPLYWVFLHFWIKIFSYSEFFLRLPSAIFSFFSVIILFRIGVSLFDKRTALLSSLFIGLSPFQLWYAQEDRDYSMLLFFSLLSTGYFLRVLKTNNMKPRIYFVLASLAGLYTNYFMSFLLAGQFLYLLFQKKTKNTGYFYLILLGFIFYLPKLIKKATCVQEGFWVLKPEWTAPFITLGNFILGYNALPWSFTVAIFIIVVLLVVGIKRAFRKRQDMRESILICSFLLFIPVSMIFLFSHLIFSVYLTRCLILFSPYLYLLLSAGVYSLNKAMQKVFLFMISCLLISGVAGYFSDLMVMPLEFHSGTYIKRPVRPIVDFLKRNVKKGDTVAFTNNALLPPVIFYGGYNWTRISYFFDPKYPENTWQRPMRINYHNVPLDRISGLSSTRFWILSGDWARDGEMDENSCSVNTWMTENFQLDYRNTIEGLRIFRYIRKKP